MRMVLASWCMWGLAGFVYLLWAGRRHIGIACPRWIAVGTAALFIAAGPFTLIVAGGLFLILYRSLIPPDNGRTRSTPTARCERCGWPLARSVAEGCVQGNCSERPLPPIHGRADEH